jgi:hypothetical protein
MGHSIRESDGESFEDHGNGQEMTAASGPSTPLPFSLSFATPVQYFGTRGQISHPIRRVKGGTFNSAITPPPHPDADAV